MTESRQDNNLIFSQLNKKNVTNTYCIQYRKTKMDPTMDYTDNSLKISLLK